MLLWSVVIFWPALRASLWKLRQNKIVLFFLFFIFFFWGGRDCHKDFRGRNVTLLNTYDSMTVLICFFLVDRQWLVKNRIFHSAVYPCWDRTDIWLQTTALWVCVLIRVLSINPKSDWRLIFSLTISTHFQPGRWWELQKSALYVGDCLDLPPNSQKSFEKKCMKVLRRPCPWLYKWS